MPSPRPPDRSPEPDRLTGSPATAVTLGAGLLGLLVSFNRAAYPIALFLAAVALAALPLALADRHSGGSVRRALVGATAAVLALVLVLVPLLFSPQQEQDRRLPVPRRTALPLQPPTGAGRLA